MADWGEEEDENDQQTNDSYETSESGATVEIKPLQQPNFGELIAEAEHYLPPSLKISSVKTNKVSISDSDPIYLCHTSEIRGLCLMK